MQTLQQQLIALNKRANAASEAIKQIEKVSGKIEVKNEEIKALEAGLPACPEGRTKAGLTKRIETLKSSVQKLTEELSAATTKAGIILDLTTPYNPAPAATEEAKPDTEEATSEAETEQSAATGTEGGESPAE